MVYQVDGRILRHLHVTAPHLGTALTEERMVLLGIILDLEAKLAALASAGAAAQCECHAQLDAVARRSRAEIDSGHIDGCWMPALRAALVKASP